MGHPSIDHASIAKWLPRAKQGDETALGMLIDLTQDHLFRFCMYLCNNPSQAEDLCQETFLKCLDRLESVQDEKGLLPWLFKIAKNQFIDFTRSARPKEEGLGEQAEMAQNTESDVILTVRECLSRLTPEERIVLVLVDSEGCSYREAAQVVGITEEALKSRVFRARKAFLRLFEKS